MPSADSILSAASELRKAQRETVYQFMSSKGSHGNGRLLSFSTQYYLAAVRLVAGHPTWFVVLRMSTGWKQGDVPRICRTRVFTHVNQNQNAESMSAPKLSESHLES